MKCFRSSFPLCMLLIFAMSNSTMACSVCFGDPDNPMTRGAVAGVYVMVGFIGFVLLGIAGTACFWMVRSRRINLSPPPPRNST